MVRQASLQITDFNTVASSHLIPRPYPMSDTSYRKVMHEFFFGVSILAGMLKFHQYNLKFSLQTQYFFMRNSNQRSVNYATNMARILLSSTCEEQRSVVKFLWAKEHNLSDVHRDMCGVYGDDCMDRSNVSRWCAFFKAVIPFR